MRNHVPRRHETFLMISLVQKGCHRCCAGIYSRRHIIKSGVLNENGRICVYAGVLQRRKKIGNVFFRINKEKHNMVDTIMTSESPLVKVDFPKISQSLEPCLFF